MPWLVAFSFGIPVALLFFSIGVEIGQLVFVAAVLSVIWLLRYDASRRWDAALVKRAFDNLDVSAAYAIDRRGLLVD